MLKRLIQALLSLLPGLAIAQTQPAPAEIARLEQQMSSWLAHPMEFGVQPKRATYFATVRAKLPVAAAFTDVHIVEYEMPDGTYGRGLVNPTT
jgi:hypothetical protein